MKRYSLALDSQGAYMRECEDGQYVLWDQTQSSPNVGSIKEELENAIEMNFFHLSAADIVAYDQPALEKDRKEQKVYHRERIFGLCIFAINANIMTVDEGNKYLERLKTFFED